MYTETKTLSGSNIESGETRKPIEARNPYEGQLDQSLVQSVQDKIQAIIDLESTLINDEERIELQYDTNDLLSVYTQLDIEDIKKVLISQSFLPTFYDEFTLSATSNNREVIRQLRTAMEDAYPTIKKLRNEKLGSPAPLPKNEKPKMAGLLNKLGSIWTKKYTQAYENIRELRTTLDKLERGELSNIRLDERTEQQLTYESNLHKKQQRLEHQLQNPNGLNYTLTMLNGPNKLSNNKAEQPIDIYNRTSESLQRSIQTASTTLDRFRTTDGMLTDIAELELSTGIMQVMINYLEAELSFRNYAMTKQGIGVANLIPPTETFNAFLRKLDSARNSNDPQLQRLSGFLNQFMVDQFQPSQKQVSSILSMAQNIPPRQLQSGQHLADAVLLQMQQMIQPVEEVAASTNTPEAQNLNAVSKNPLNRLRQLGNAMKESLNSDGDLNDVDDTFVPLPL
jgi:hypothetical protein